MSFTRNQDGIVAMEFAVVASLLVPLLLATADIGQYLQRRLQVEGVAVAAARSVAHNCIGTLPALTKCGVFDAVVADVVAASTIGKRVALEFDEGDYCVVADRLERTGAAGKGAPCGGKSKGKGKGGGGGGGVAAGDYLIVTATFGVDNLFLGDGVGGVLPATIVRTTVLRLK